jgi:hypothetical protein
MPAGEFELSLPAIKRLQTYALDHMATRIDGLTILQLPLPDTTLFQRLKLKAI